MEYVCIDTDAVCPSSVRVSSWSTSIMVDPNPFMLFKTHTACCLVQRCMLCLICIFPIYNAKDMDTR